MKRLLLLTSALLLLSACVYRDQDRLIALTWKDVDAIQEEDGWGMETNGANAKDVLQSLIMEGVKAAMLQQGRGVSE